MPTTRETIKTKTLEILEDNINWLRLKAMEIVEDEIIDPSNEDGSYELPKLICCALARKMAERNEPPQGYPRRKAKLAKVKKITIKLNQ